MKNLCIILTTVLLVLFISGCAEVGPQQGGVRTNFIGFGSGIGETQWFKQGIKSKPLQPGLYLHIPHVTIVDIYNVNERQYHMTSKAEQETRDDVAFKTKDGQKAWISVSIRYRIDFLKLPEFHRHYGDEYLKNVLRPAVRSLVNNKLGEYSAEQIYDGKTRQLVAKEIRDLVNAGYQNQEGTAQYGLIVGDILFRRFEFSEEYQAAIEQKRIAAEQALAAEQWAIKREKEAIGEKMAIIQKAEAEAERIRKEAEANRFAKEQEAEGIRAEGHAEAEVQELMAAALGGGDNIVRMEFARHLGEGFQVWGIPTGENSNSIMDVSGILGGMFPRIKPSNSAQ